MRRIFSVLLLLCASFAYSQNTGIREKTWIANTDSINETRQDYLQFLYSKQSAITDFINGHQYQFYFDMRNPNPLFLSVEEIPVRIFIDGQMVDDIKIHYDIYKDELIYRHPKKLIDNAYCLIELNKCRIDSFHILSAEKTYRFRNFVFAGDENNIPDGYYEVLYDNENQFIIKHYAVQKLTVTDVTYEHRKDRYVKIDGNFYLIKRRHHLLNAMADKRNEIKKFIRSNYIYVPTATDESILNIIRYYDSL